MNLLKKIFFLFLGTIVIVNTKAQLTTILNIQANPSSSLSSWASTPQTVTLLVNNISQTPKAFKIKTTIKTTSGEAVAVSDVTKVATLTSVGASSAVYNANIAVPMESMIFSGSYNSILQRSGKLPTGTYQLCIQLVNPIDYAVITQEQCRVFNIAVLQLPFLISPAPESKLEKNIAQSIITFRWTPLVPRPIQQIVKYRIQVFEVLQNQKPMQAFRANIPVLDNDVIGTTQYIWRPQLDMTDGFEITKDSVNTDPENNNKLEIIKTFIWTVQTLTKDGALGVESPVTEGSINGDGRSQPEIFYIVKRKIAKK